MWEKFELEWRPGMNVISAMMEIAANPVTADGRPTTPITYDSNCLEEICGSCAMRINGKARMACSALVDNLEQPIKIEPLSKFPLVRDLQVDRSVLFDNLMAVKAWVPVDGTYDLGSGPRVFPQQQEANYPLSNCISAAPAAWRSARSSTNQPVRGQVLWRNGPAWKASAILKQVCCCGDASVQVQKTSGENDASERGKQFHKLGSVGGAVYARSAFQLVFMAKKRQRRIVEVETGNRFGKLLAHGEQIELPVKLARFFHVGGHIELGAAFREKRSHHRSGAQDIDCDPDFGSQLSGRVVVESYIHPHNRARRKAEGRHWASLGRLS